MPIPPKIKKMIAHNSSIGHLDLSGCELTDEDINEVVTILNTTGCQSLDISRNDITEEGAAVLATVSTLKKLNIANNYLDDAGLLCFIGTSITHLVANNNGISISAASKAYASKHFALLDTGYHLDHEGNEVPISDIVHTLNKTDEVWKGSSFLHSPPINKPALQQPTSLSSSNLSLFSASGLPQQKNTTLDLGDKESEDKKPLIENLEKISSVKKQLEKILESPPQHIEQHIEIVLELSPVDLSLSSDANHYITELAQLLGELGKFGELKRLGRVQYVSLTLHLPILDFSKADTAVANNYLDKRESLEIFQNTLLTPHLPDSDRGFETKKSMDSSSNFLYSPVVSARVSRTDVMFPPSIRTVKISGSEISITGGTGTSDRNQGVCCQLM